MSADIQQPIQIQPDVSCTVDSSIGLVFAPEHSEVLHELLVNADDTINAVKPKGRGHNKFYSPEHYSAFIPLIS